NGQTDLDGELIAEDMLAFFWADPEIFPDFDQQTCAVTCHAYGEGSYYHGTPRRTYLDAWI
ncbi:hypothetical protein KAU45_09490, partial [bacterium]|nr:hypothetical protein [bacterium]